MTNIQKNEVKNHREAEPLNRLLKKPLRS